MVPWALIIALMIAATVTHAAAVIAAVHYLREW